LTRGEMGFAEVLKLVIIRTRDDKVRKSGGMPLMVFMVRRLF